MRIGERTPGFTYLWLIFALAIGGAALAALGTQWHTAVLRDREIELEFRGRQIALALESFARASPQGTSPWPDGLEALLDDRRSGSSKRHLRRLYEDPFTGRADWVLITDPQGHLLGVHSRSEVPAMRGQSAKSGLPGASPPDGIASAAGGRIADKLFMAQTPASGAVAVAVSPSAAASSVRP